MRTSSAAVSHLDLADGPPGFDCLPYPFFHRDGPSLVPRREIPGRPSVFGSEPARSRNAGEKSGAPAPEGIGMRISLPIALILVAVLSPSAEATVARTELTLTLAKGEKPFPAVKKRSLTCDPVGGTHPFARQACRDLKRSDGDFRRLPGDPRHSGCPRDYWPVTVTARGFWKGRPIAFKHTYGNDCTRNAESGPVFRL
ncbi:subtilase-type protease inhibitor [Allokutzneria oryzae]|uniref:Subtilase-type protease inhibitor n=1 Tax=Allokutzneria oryzae TaxID=1378989 RepID=A0ABV6A1J2_9PSEU